MIGVKASDFVLFVALVAIAVIAAAEQYIITGDFVERRSSWAFSHLDGKFYYLYDTANVNNSRLRLDYAISYLNGSKISNLYHYEHNAMYSMCTEKCTGVKVSERPDPWWIVNTVNGSSLYEKNGTVKDGKHWYTRTGRINETTQVMKILMNEGATSPSADYIRALEFYDGRSYSLSNVVVDTTHTAEDPIFSPNDNCPTPSCPIFADIVFVLDSSGSVTHLEWQESVKFVNLVMDSFTFGPNAVAAAVVQFNGQDNKCPYTTTKHPDCKGKTRYTADCNWPTPKTHPHLANNPDLMTTVLASQDYGEGDTVSYNKDQLMRNLNNTVRDSCLYPPNGDKNKCQAFSGWRGTCQALGLQMAMEVLDRSPRRNYKTKPANIVIVVTDGEDKFPNVTERNATLLKNPPYNAFLIEVGVGLECKYDKDLLTRIASRLGSENDGAYFDAKDYDEIKRVADELFRPLCDSNYSSECGPECKGFCGCGQCLCPECDESEDICHTIQCNVSGSFSNGCVVLETTYSVPNDECTTWMCNATKINPSSSKKGEWYPYIDPCDEWHENYTGSCRNVYCDADFGGCRVEINKSYCSQFSNACEVYECTPLGTPADTDTGCRLAKNFTQTCIDNLGSKSACFEIVCDGSSSDCDDMLVDTCTSMNNACETFACTLNVTDGSYGCVGTFTRNHVNTSCKEWKCDYEGTEGWVVKVERDEKYCSNLYNKSGIEMRCKDFYCNPDEVGTLEGGCYFEERKGCSFECTSDNETSCRARGAQASDDTKCIFDYCYVIQSGSNFTVACASEAGESKVENCMDPLSSSGKRALELNNAYSDQCWTPYCDFGKCTVMQVDLPSDKIGNRCMEPHCRIQDDGSWNWVLEPTQENSTCHNDACYTKYCDPDQGCVSTDNCTVWSNECYSYECVLDGNNKPLLCNETNLTKEFQHLECFDEQCVDGKKVTYYPACETNDKCMHGTCVKGQCKFEPNSPPGNDLCQIYTCNSSTGEWSVAPRCNDGLYCTEDECWNYGSFYECHFIPIDCGLDLEMDGYECFRPSCKEYASNQTYRCMRKLLRNAFIDICGNCIKENPLTENSYSSSGSDILLTCTNAPPQPLMVQALAAGTIGLIIIAAIIIGAAITTSSVMATKSLIARVRAASNQTAQTNPLFEGVETELQNPTYAGGER